MSNVRVRVAQWTGQKAEGMKAGTVCSQVTLVSDVHNVWKKLVVSSTLRL